MTPRLSAILVAVAQAPPPVHALALLRGQTAAADIEVIVVGDGDLASFEAAGLAGVRRVAVAAGATLGRLLAAGVEAASAPWVVYVEEHVFFDADWAERLLAAGDGADAVGPAFANANPTTTASWAALLAGFADYVAPAPGAAPTDLPWHGTAYRRATLAPLAGRLEPLLECSGLLHSELVARGGRFVLAPGCTTRHFNVGTLRALLATEALAGCALASGLPVARRVWLALLGPAIAARRLRTLRAARRRAAAAGPVPRGTTALGALALGAFAAGLVAGVVVPAERVARRQLSIEIDRARYVRRDDAERLEGARRALVTAAR